VSGAGGVWLAALTSGVAVALALPPRARLPAVRPVAPARAGPNRGWMLRHRALVALLAGAGAALLVGGGAGPVAAVAGAAAAWVVIGRAEPPAVRRAREEVRRDLPHVVALLAATLRAGAAPGDGVAVVCAALPGAAADRLAGVPSRLALGVDPVRVWESLAADPDLAPLGRTLARAQATGAPVVAAVSRLADDLARRSRAEVEERARAVGVKAALPLGLCLLPAFVLIGIVPLVAALLSTLVL
jgi:Flp pilus assembly protein TadB